MVQESKHTEMKVHLKLRALFSKISLWTMLRTLFSSIKNMQRLKAVWLASFPLFSFYSNIWNMDTNFFFVGLMKDSKVLISDVEFSNIRGTTISKIAVVLACSQSFPCKGITLKDIHLEYTGDPDHNEDTPFSSNCTNVKVNYIGEQLPPPCA